MRMVPSRLYEVTYWDDNGYRHSQKYGNMAMMLDDVRVILESESDRVRIESFEPFTGDE